VRRRHRCSRFGGPNDLNDLNRCLANRNCQPRTDEVQAQHAQKRIEQGMENLGWMATTPDGGKRKQTDKIVNAPLKVPDFAGSKFGLDFHIRQP
jgi:hypothetical protein